MNGTRQPHEPIWSSVSSSEKPSISNAPSEKPESVPNSRKLPRNPRRRYGAYAAINVAAPPYSPPVENLWIIRSTTIMAGAHNPIAA